MDGNSLTGTIPASFSELAMLEAVDLSNLELSGELPDTSFMPQLKLCNSTSIGNVCRGSGKVAAGCDFIDLPRKLFLMQFVQTFKKYLNQTKTAQPRL